MQLLLREWRLRVPSLVISVLGGLANAPLQAKLGSVVKRGLLRAAKTTGAWVITNGLDTGKSIRRPFFKSVMSTVSIALR